MAPRAADLAFDNSMYTHKYHLHGFKNLEKQGLIFSGTYKC